MKLEEITLEAVDAAYARNGFKPTACNIKPENGRCCMLGALTDGNACSLYNAADILGITSFEAWAIATGFDAGTMGRPIEYGNRFYQEAYEIGFNIGKTYYDRVEREL